MQNQISQKCKNILVSGLSTYVEAQAFKYVQLCLYFLRKLILQNFPKIEKF